MLSNVFSNSIRFSFYQFCVSFLLNLITKVGATSLNIRGGNLILAMFVNFSRGLCQIPQNSAEKINITYVQMYDSKITILKGLLRTLFDFERSVVSRVAE